MKLPKLTKIWINDNRSRAPFVSDRLLAIRADFDNGRCYESAIYYPYERDSVAQALQNMATMLRRDPLLAPDVTPDGRN